MERLNQYSEIDLYLLQTSQPFVIKMTMNTKRIIAPDAKIMLSESHLSGRELGFLRRVKSEAEFYRDFLCKNRSVDRSNIRYVKLDSVPRGTYRDYIELDINRAYWETAYRMGVISQSTYNNADKYSKRVRLIALGALATGRIDMMFDGVELTEIESEKEASEDTSFIFFKIAYAVGVAVNSIYLNLNEIEPGGCLGYWVDAVFVKKHLAQKAQELFYDLFSFECKEVLLSSLTVVEKEHDKKVYMIERKTKTVCTDFEKSDIRVKSFSMPGYKVRQRKRKAAKGISEALRKLGY